jgi:hypothetical protein
MDGRGYKDCTDDCYETYLNWSPRRTLCLIKCSAFNRKIEAKIAFDGQGQALTQEQIKRQQYETCKQFSSDMIDMRACLMAMTVNNMLGGRIYPGQSIHKSQTFLNVCNKNISSIILKSLLGVQNKYIDFVNSVFELIS